jgi:arginyl-tRNA synthetase
MQDQIIVSTSSSEFCCYISHILRVEVLFGGHFSPEMLSQLSSSAKKMIEKKYSIKDVNVSWAVPRESGFGDLSTSIALQIAKRAQVNPREIADAIAEQLRSLEGVEKAEVAGAGYVNVTLTPMAIFAAAHEGMDAARPQKVRSKDAPIIVDYCGPNIAKPLGIHHILAHVVGQAIINLYRHNGDHVIGWSYPGDWGTQFGKLSVAYDMWGNGKDVDQFTVEDLLKLYVKFHEEAEKNSALEDSARAAFLKLESGDARLRQFWKDVVKITYEDLEHLYKRLQINVDVVTGESFYQDKMDPVIAEAKKKKILKEGKEGAMIVEFPEEKNMPPLLLQKKDGATLYATRDLAMIRHRLDAYKPRALYYVVDVAQSLHFAQLFETATMLGWNMPECEHTLFGRMRFADGSMSTRKGTVLRLEEVLDEAVQRADAIIEERGEGIQTDDPKALAEMMGVGALVYGVLSQNRKLDIVFDWKKVLSFEGNSAPYLQYTHARARSVLRKADSQASLPQSFRDLSEHDRIVLRSLMRFPSVLEEARENRMPHTLCNYLYQLCQDFNAFYNAEPILKAEGDVRAQRLSITAMTADVLRGGASILTLRLPERM